VAARRHRDLRHGAHHDAGDDRRRVTARWVRNQSALDINCDNKLPPDDSWKYTGSVRAGETEMPVYDRATPYSSYNSVVEG
jgi:hypothetical protein